MSKNFPIFSEGNRYQGQESPGSSKQNEPKKNTPMYIIIKMVKVKVKESLLKVARKKQHITYKGNPIRLSVDFSAETLQTRKQLHDIFKC